VCVCVCVCVCVITRNGPLWVVFSDSLSEGKFAKDVSLLTYWPKDYHMHGLGEDKRIIIGLGGLVRVKP
jgi:hypothetical protein